MWKRTAAASTRKLRDRSHVVVDMERRTQGWWVLVVVLAGCGAEVDVIDHGGDVDESTSAGDEEVREHNFPDPLLALCGELPDGVVPIGGLASAYAVSGPRPAAFAVDPAAVRLRLAEFGIAPNQLVQRECGPAGWMFAFELPTPLAPGIYPLADLVQPYPEGYYGFESGCGTAEGLLPDAQPSETGVLEIFAVTDGCVVGEIRDGFEQAALSLVRNGGFVAERTVADCVPLASHDC